MSGRHKQSTCQTRSAPDAEGAFPQSPPIHDEPCAGSEMPDVPAEQVRMLYDGSSISLPVSVTIAALFSMAQWNVVDRPTIALWFGAVIIVGLVRAALVFAYRRARPAPSELSRWMHLYVGGAGMAGACWGGAGIFIFPADPLAHQVFTAFVVTSVAAGAVTVLAPVVAAFVAFVIPALLPLVVRFLMVGDQLHLILALMTVLFAVFILVQGWRSNRTLLASLRLRNENQDLLRYLDRERQRLSSRLGRILSRSVNEIYVLDAATLRYVQANPSACDNLGYTAQELQHMTPDQVTPDLDLSQWRERVASLLARTTDQVGCSALHQRRDGTSYPVELSMQLCESEQPPVIVAIAQDVSEKEERRVAERALHAQSTLMQSVVTSAPVILCALDREGVFTLSEGKGLRALGVPPGEVVGRSVFDVYGNDEQVLRNIARALKGELFVSDVELRGRHFESHYSPLLDEAGEPDGAVIVSLDVTERRREQQRLLLHAAVIENTGEGVMITDPELRIVSVNRAFTEITGYQECEVLGQTPRLLRSGRHDESFFRQMWDAIDQDGIWRGEIWNKRKNSEIYPEWLTVSPLRDRSGTIMHYLGIFSDISDLKRAEEEYEYVSNFDALTGLPNRFVFLTQVEHAIGVSHADTAVLWLDLDRFKDINDSLGHDLGDQLLREVAQRLQRGVHAGDVVARLGDDEFAVLLHGLAVADRAATVAEKLLASLDAPFDLQGNEVIVRASIGIATASGDPTTAAELMRHADSAMHRAKQLGRARFAFYSPELTENARRRVSIEAGLRRAIKRGEFELHYQPQVSLLDGELVGAEALIRWRHPSEGLISPSIFIPIAEETGQIALIGEWVLRRAAADVRAWGEAGLTPVPVAVNVSGDQLTRTPFAELVEELILTAGIRPADIEIELTESFFMQHRRLAVNVLDQLKRAGHTLSIDDFGTGYSSLSYVQTLPVDKLKLDRSFVHRLPGRRDALRIVRAVVAMAHGLGLQVVAEGVENQKQEQLLRREGCDYAQGFLYGRPLSARSYELLLNRRGQRPALALIEDPLA